MSGHIWGIYEDTLLGENRTAELEVCVQVVARSSQGGHIGQRGFWVDDQDEKTNTDQQQKMPLCKPLSMVLFADRVKQSFARLIHGSGSVTSQRSVLRGSAHVIADDQSFPYYHLQGDYVYQYHCLSSHLAKLPARAPASRLFWCIMGKEIV